MAHGLQTMQRSRPTMPESFQGLRVHMIGIGGAGMSGAAVVLLKFGATVSGSDEKPFEAMSQLVARGARVTIGHDEQLLDAATDLVVVSAAIPPTNPELVKAGCCGVRIWKYAELLGAIMDHRQGVAIAGTHGKSTTTAMCAWLFRQAGLDPSFVVGAQSPQLGGGSGVGTGPHFIVESCEFDRSFLHLRPKYAAILNIEHDHLDCYKDLDEIVDAFGQFAANVAGDGFLICNAQDRWARAAAARAAAPVQTFGFEEDADWQALNLRNDRGRYGFDVQFRGSPVLTAQLAIPGRYNVENALAAIALACGAGAAPQRLVESLAAFAGVGRRLTLRGEGAGVTIVDDYAHHPTEVRVTIEAARYRYQPKRMWVVFQPHQHARIRIMMDDFARAFGGADEVIVPEVYGAREAVGDAPANSLSGSEELVSRICHNGGSAMYLPTLPTAAEHVARNVTEGDLVLTMGAGDVWKVADELVARICGQHAVQCPARAIDMVQAGWTGAVPLPTA